MLGWTVSQSKNENSFSKFNSHRSFDKITKYQGNLKGTGKSLSEAPIFASTNPQFDNRLFIELQVQYMKIPSSNLVRTRCVQ